MKNLSDVPTSWLEEELKKRKNSKQFEKVENPDFTPLIKLAEEILQRELNDDSDEDDQQWCYETLMQVVYGEDFFDKLRKAK